MFAVMLLPNIEPPLNKKHAARQLAERRCQINAISCTWTFTDYLMVRR